MYGAYTRLRVCVCVCVCMSVYVCLHVQGCACMCTCTCILALSVQLLNALEEVEHYGRQKQGIRHMHAKFIELNSFYYAKDGKSRRKVRESETWADSEQGGVFSSLAKQPQLMRITRRRVRLSVCQGLRRKRK